MRIQPQVSGKKRTKQTKIRACANVRELATSRPRIAEYLRGTRAEPKQILRDFGELRPRWTLPTFTATQNAMEFVCD